MHYTQQKHIKGVTLDDIYIGNGVSELIVMAMNALLNAGDEVLVPAPDYPLWTAAVSLSAARRCTISATKRTTGCPTSTTCAPRSRPHTRASWSSTRTTRPARCIRTACWSEIVAIARQHNLIIYADEVYDKVLYDGMRTRRSPRCRGRADGDLQRPVKNYRSCGYRAGWMVVSGDLRTRATTSRA
jgi:alanine-synthesizing transaminase